MSKAINVKEEIEKFEKYLLKNKYFKDNQEIREDLIRELNIFKKKGQFFRLERYRLLSESVFIHMEIIRRSRNTFTKGSASYALSSILAALQLRSYEEAKYTFEREVLDILNYELKSIKDSGSNTQYDIGKATALCEIADYLTKTSMQ